MIIARSSSKGKGEMSIRQLLLIAAAISFLVVAGGCQQQQSQSPLDNLEDLSPDDLGTPQEELPVSESKEFEPVEDADSLIASIETSKGVFEFEFFSAEAPNTVANFINLARDGFYDGIKFHRVEPGFVVQGGDPNSKDADPNNDGQGGPGYTIKAEFSELRHVTGTVAMARQANDPDSAGSQFYVTLSPQPSLDGQYAVFGQLTSGIDVIEKIEPGDTIVKVTIKSKQ